MIRLLGFKIFIFTFCFSQTGLADDNACKFLNSAFYVDFLSNYESMDFSSKVNLEIDKGIQDKIEKVNYKLNHFYIPKRADFSVSYYESPIESLFFESDDLYIAVFVDYPTLLNELKLVASEFSEKELLNSLEEVSFFDLLKGGVIGENEYRCIDGLNLSDIEKLAVSSLGIEGNNYFGVVHDSPIFFVSKNYERLVMFFRGAQKGTLIKVDIEGDSSYIKKFFFLLMNILQRDDKGNSKYLESVNFYSYIEIKDK